MFREDRILSVVRNEFSATVNTGRLTTKTIISPTASNSHLEPRMDADLRELGFGWLLLIRSNTYPACYLSEANTLSVHAGFPRPRLNHSRLFVSFRGSLFSALICVHLRLFLCWSSLLAHHDGGEHHQDH